MRKGETVDVVCGKPIDQTEGFKSDYGDRPYYFCSQNCQEGFVSDPLKYVNPSGAAASQAGTPVIEESGQETTNQSH